MLDRPSREARFFRPFPSSTQNTLKRERVSIIINVYCINVCKHSNHIKSQVVSIMMILIFIIDLLCRMSHTTRFCHVEMDRDTEMYIKLKYTLRSDEIEEEEEIEENMRVPIT